MITVELVYTDPETSGAVADSCVPDGSLNDMLTVIPTSMYSAGRFGAISQLQLRLTCDPIGRMGLGGSLVIFNSIIGPDDVEFTYNNAMSIINHTLLSVYNYRAVISTLTCISMASNSMNDSRFYLTVQVQIRVLLLP